MRTTILLAMMLALSVASGQEPAATTTTEIDPVAKRLDEVLSRLDKIEKRLDEQKQLIEMPEHEKFQRRQGQQFQGPQFEELRKLKLPDNPTREQARQYVADIVRLSAGQNSFSSNDPQPAMFRRVGPQHLDVLIEFLSDDGRSQSHSYVSQAVVALASEEHKPLVLEKLASRPALISIVEKLGWERDARQVLIQGLRDRPGKLPVAWIEIVAGFSDPETYPALLEHLARCEEPAPVYRSLEDLPGIDLDAAVARAWKRADGAQLQRGPWAASEFAPIAAAHGSLNALESLLNQIDQPFMHGHRGFGAPPSARRIILRLIDFSGTNQEIKDWFDKNAGQIQFDKKSRRYVVSPKAA